jgi:hypothetical protein
MRVCKAVSTAWSCTVIGAAGPSLGDPAELERAGRSQPANRGGIDVVGARHIGLRLALREGAGGPLGVGGASASEAGRTGRPCPDQVIDEGYPDFGLQVE